MKKSWFFLLPFILVFILSYCSVKSVPSRDIQIRVKIYEGKQVRISGEDYIIKIGRHKFEVSFPIVFYSSPGRKFYSLDLGEIQTEEVRLSDEEFILKKDGQFHIFHGKYPSRNLALKALEDLGEGEIVILWEKDQSGIKVKLGKDWYQAEEMEIKPKIGLLKVNNKPYRGSLQIKESAKGLDVINQLPLEDFIKGCKVDDELPPEAMKALAVVLRTNAMSRPSPLEAHFFGYLGLQGERADFSKAVLNTKGLVLFYGSSPIPVPYTISCGGETETMGKPYLKKVRCWISRKVLTSEIPHYLIGSSILEAIGLVKIEDEDEKISPEEAQTLLWKFSRFIGVEKYFPVSSPVRRGFLSALGSTLMAVKPDHTPEPLEYLLDASIIDEDDLKEEDLTWGDAAEFLYKSLIYLNALKWKYGKVEIKNGKVYLNGERLEGVYLFRHNRKGIIPASRVLVFDGERVKFLRDIKGKISAILGDGLIVDPKEKIWIKRYSMENLEERLNYYFPVGEIQDLRVKGKLPSGRVLKMEVEGVNDVYILEGEEILKYLGLPSNWFILDREFDEDGNIVGFFFTGVGEGNGMGLCLEGAKRLAKEGKNFREILNLFYNMEIKGVKGEGGKRRSH